MIDRAWVFVLGLPFSVVLMAGGTAPEKVAGAGMAVMSIIIVAYLLTSGTEYRECDS